MAVQTDREPIQPMPISGSSSYVETLPAFNGHWKILDGFLAPKSLVIALPDGSLMTQLQFEALMDGVEAQAFAVQDQLIGQGILRGAIHIKKKALLERLNQFNGALDAYFKGTRWFRARPRVPGIGEGEERFVRPLRDAATLWAKINAAPPPPGVTLPLTLADGMTQEDFDAEVKALQSDYAAEDNAAQDVTLARADRDALQEIAYAAMKSYRAAVPVKVPGQKQFIGTLPRLTPLPGHTPAPVAVSGDFVAPDRSKVRYEASADKDLRVYQLRGTAGAKYDERDAVVLATHGPHAPREFVVSFALGQPGAVVALKVFVVLVTGNECGSEAVLVQRPAADATRAA